MIVESSIQIDAPAAVVWDVFADVERWSEWTPSVSSLRGLDGSHLEVGRRFQIKQPKLPLLVWEVTDLDPGHGWTWRVHSPGATTVAVHEVVRLDGDRTLVRQRIDQRGPLGTVAAALTKRLTRRYLDLEGQGLKARSEARLHGAPSA
jgi:uncharacterized membrane protein